MVSISPETLVLATTPHLYRQIDASGVMGGNSI